MPKTAVVLFAIWAFAIDSSQDRSDNAVVIGKVKSADIHFTFFGEKWGYSYSGEVTLEVANIVKAPEYIRRDWFQGRRDIIEAKVQFHEKYIPTWLVTDIRAERIFLLYALDDTNEFGVSEVLPSTTSNLEKYGIAKKRQN